MNSLLFISTDADLRKFLIDCAVMNNSLACIVETSKMQASKEMCPGVGGIQVRGMIERIFCV